MVLRSYGFEWQRRSKAAALHLLGCLVIAALVGALILLVWYPWPYRVISGGESLLLLVLGVDVVMGPLITFAIFDARKPTRELARDLTIVVALQLAALGYGLHTVWVARPVVLAFEGERFRVSTAVEIVEAELPKAPAGLQRLSWTGPVTVDTAAVPKGGEEQLQTILMGLGGADLGMRPSFWRPWTAASGLRALKASKAIPSLTGEAGQRVAEAVQRTGRPAAELRVVPMLARRSDWSVLIDGNTGQPLGFAPVDSF